MRLGMRLRRRGCCLGGRLGWRKWSVGVGARASGWRLLLWVCLGKSSKQSERLLRGWLGSF